MIEVTDVDAFGAIPPCADPRFDHRTCDYWEDADRGSKAHRPGWLQVDARPAPRSAPASDNPFAPPGDRGPAFNPFDPSAARGGTEGLARAAADLFGDDDPFGIPADNPFAPRRERERPLTAGVPRKLALLDRGRGVFGSYAKVLRHAGRPVAYTQFGPLSAYPRALRVRDLYPQLPQAPLPAVISCIASVGAERRQGHALHLVRLVCEDLAGRGFSAVEAYPEPVRNEDETSAAWPAFWHSAGFLTAVDDERFPVMRRELD